MDSSRTLHPEFSLLSCDKKKANNELRGNLEDWDADGTTFQHAKEQIPLPLLY